MTETIADIYRQRVADGSIRPDPAQEQVLPRLEALRAHFADVPDRKGLRGLFSKPPEPPKGLYLWGGVGRGKSMLMDLFFAAVPVQAKRRVHFHAFMQEVQQGLEEARKSGARDAILPVAARIASDIRLLCFDEMQISDIADAMIVGRLFEKLFEDGVVVVTTSNRHPDALYKDGLNRQLFLPFIDLIKARMEVHHLVAGADYRQDRLAGEDTYFTPADAAARAAIDTLFDALSGGAAPEPLTLKIKGREVSVPDYANGVARATFWDLCAKPLGPADYLALAEAVRVLILEEVPRLSSENYNEARRFVTLIDALYEARTRLVISAADVPERLYFEGEGSFEFERTASRLREMQSDGWGS
ncbi:cell division protein ZapE [Anianabacter salinae]|uniref:cell division protein ZapE n=1 Tax=Anianabacter salinae TaxID=2851023 RepID=UPI00225E5A2D|nr:cell division protein ZapE [Anianabacter salinae]MBV0913324.1 AFG1 family ATPase [Anianabacter salinae]